LPFVPDAVEMWNWTVNASKAQHGVPYAYWDVNMGQGFAFEEVFTASAITGDSVIANGISTFTSGSNFLYGVLQLLNGSGGMALTDATTITVTTTAAHGLTPGNWVTFQNLYQTATTGMQQIAGIPFEILSAATTTTFTIGWNGTGSSGLTAITTGGYKPGSSYMAGFKQILYPALYVPGIAYPWSITNSGSDYTVSTTAPHNFVVGQEIGFRIPSLYGASELNVLQNYPTPGKPRYFYVTSVTKDAFHFNFNGTVATAFNTNQAFSAFPGLGFAQVFAVGDVNTGGVQYSGGNLYPSPLVYSGNSLTQNSTINGSGIQGAFVTNTNQGFIIGSGAGVSDASSKLVGAASDVIYYRAYLHDVSNP
jgi:hypothetical protein